MTRLHPLTLRARGGVVSGGVLHRRDFLNMLADAERDVGVHFQADLKEGTMFVPSPEWTKWERAQDAFARSMAFRKLAETEPQPRAEP